MYIMEKVETGLQPTSHVHVRFVSNMFKYRLKRLLGVLIDTPKDSMVSDPLPYKNIELLAAQGPGSET